MASFYDCGTAGTSPITVATSDRCPCCGQSLGNHRLIYRSDEPLEVAFNEQTEKAKKRRPRPPKNFRERREWWNRS